MAYLDNSSLYVSAVITDYGKNILASNPAKFKIVKYSFSDDEIDYADSLSSITATQVPQPNVSVSAFNDYLKSLPDGTVRVANIVLDPSHIVMDANTIISCNVSTDIMTESLGYTIYSNSDNIAVETIDTIDDIANATKVANLIVANLTNGDLVKFSKFKNINKVLKASAIVCKSAFQIKAKNVIGKYTLTVVGNKSKAKATLEIHVKI